MINWLFRSIALVCGMALVAPLTSQAAAGVVETRISPQMLEIGCTVRLSGLIESGDADRLSAVLSSAPSYQDFGDRLQFSPSMRFGFPYATHRLCLDSPGGNFLEAIEIAERLGSYLDEYSRYGVPTGVASGDECLSACSIIFMGGRYSWQASEDSYWEYDRILHPNGRLGFHAPFLFLENRDYEFLEARQLQEVNALAVSRLMTAIGRGAVHMNSELLTDMFSTNTPDLIFVETLGQASTYDIAVAPVRTELVLAQTRAEMLRNLCDHASIRVLGYLSIRRIAEPSWALRLEDVRGNTRVTASSSAVYESLNVTDLSAHNGSTESRGFLYRCSIHAGSFPTREINNFDPQRYLETLIGSTMSLRSIHSGQEEFFRPNQEEPTTSFIGPGQLSTSQRFSHHLLPTGLALSELAQELEPLR